MKVNRVFLIGMILLSCIALSAFGQDEKTPMSHFRLGAGFATLPFGWGTGFDIHTPVFLSWNRADQTFQLNAFLDFVLFTLPNVATDSSGNFSCAYLDNFALGLRLSRRSTESWVSPYVQAGVLYSLVDSVLSSQQSTFGGIFTAGADLFFVRGESSLFVAHDTAFFVQADVLIDDKRADKVPGQPRFLTAVSPRIGIRIHY